MSKDRKKTVNLREGYESDTSLGEASVHSRAEPHVTCHKAKSHRTTHHSSEPESDAMTMIRVLMDEQRRADSEREEARWVADIERDAARRQEDFRLETMRFDRETARRAEELERERILRAERVSEAAQAAQKQIDQQEAFAAKQIEQQVALLRVQAELGKEADRLHRQELNSSRKRDRAIASISNFRDGEDVEDFILTAERRLKAGEVNVEEWVMVVASKLSSKMGCGWKDICVSVNGYHNVKDRLLKVCGYTPKLASEVFYGFRSENSKGMTADQLYHRGLQLFRRMVAPHRISEAAEFAILRG